jgi:flagellum-specific ATP synthase
VTENTDGNDDRFPLAALARRMQAVSAVVPLARPVGRVASVMPSAIAVEGLSRWLGIGSRVEIKTDNGVELAEVIRLDRDEALCQSFSTSSSVGLGAQVCPSGAQVCAPDPSWKGRIIDAFARPLDGKGGLKPGRRRVGLRATPPAAMSRQLIGMPVATGVRVIDAFLPICLGQRVGIFAGSGVGKSSLLSMLANSGSFDVIVVSLVGERGREVREFVELTLAEAASRAVTVVSTGDESPIMRRTAPLLATSIAEYFRDEGLKVLLVMDSVTRFAHACREIALAAGEPPVARGYPPSVFSQLPQLLERAGPGAEGRGTITAFYAVLVDGDDHNDPVADAVRGTLDGHIVLNRAIAGQGRYPAIDLLASISRLSHRVWSADEQKAVTELKSLVHRFEDSRDLRAMGGHVAGADPDLDRAVAVVPKLYRILSQGLGDPPAVNAFREIADSLL